MGSAAPAGDIAVIGYSCRLSGKVSSPDELWELCSRGRSGWSEIPKDRFCSDAFYHPDPLKPGTFNVKGGYFLQDDIAKFDARFFNITAKEAVSLDPQQRLLLECTFEALESSGIPKDSLAGRKVGVFIGGNVSDYEVMNLRDLETTPLHEVTGTANAMQSNRISYHFDLKGPSLTVDTACSGSLVALHYAVQSLLRGESSEAIVGGCRLNILPDTFVTMSMSQLLNDYGKTFAFDERADSGFARGEGAGVLILKPLDAALRDKDSIRAVICTSGVAQDGKTSGITQPNGDAQQNLIKELYRNAQLNPADCGFAEMHGTGTKVGDPIEAKGVHESLAQCRTAHDPLYIGSVKSNVGHLEGASGIISVIKSAMMLERKLLLPNVNFQNPNPAIPLADYNMKVLKRTRPWPRGKKYVSVSNYGFGGTIAHTVLAMAPSVSKRRPPRPDNGQTFQDPQRKLFVVSANDQDALSVRMGDLGIYFEQRPETFEATLLDDVAYTLGCRRSHLTYRIAIPATSLDEFGSKLSRLTIQPSRSLSQPKIGLVFTGQGAQWAEMGMGLMFEYEVFASAIAQADSHLRSLGSEFSLLEELQRSKDCSRIDTPSISQPACTAIQIGLVKLLRSWGIKPSVVLGHSSGEIAAAYAAKAFDANTAMALAYHRGTLTAKLKELYPDLQGGMIAVGLSTSEIVPFLRRLESGYATVACVNSPTSVTVSGDKVAIEELHDLLDNDRIFNRLLPIDVAYHSEHMARVADIYLASISHLLPSAALSTTFVSSVTGQRLKATALGPMYWVDNLISPVRFADALARACDSQERPDMLIEIGPHMALKGPIRDTLKALKIPSDKVAYSGSLIRNEDAVSSVQGTAAATYMRGVAIDMLNVNFPCTKAQSCLLLTDMPRYPWQHKSRYWHESRIVNKYKTRAATGNNDILGLLAAYSNDLEPTWRNIIRLNDLPWLRQHKFQGVPVFPFAGYMAMAIEAARQQAQQQSMPFDSFKLREVIVTSALVLNDDIDTEMTITLRPFNDSLRGDSSVWRDFRVCSWDSNRGWSEHCRGLIMATESNVTSSVGAGTQQMEHQWLQREELDMQHKARKAIDKRSLYEVMDRVGASYGPAFQGLKDCYASDEYCRGSIYVHDTALLMPKGVQSDLVIHPSFLDAFLHLTWPILGAVRESSYECLYMPTSLRSATIHMDCVKGPGESLHVWASGKADFQSPKPTFFQMHATKPGESGRPMIKFEDFVMTPIRDLGGDISSKGKRLCWKNVSRPLEVELKSDLPINGSNGTADESRPISEINGHTNGNINGNINGHTSSHTNGHTDGHANGHDTNTHSLVNGSSGAPSSNSSDIMIVRFGETENLSAEMRLIVGQFTGKQAAIHTFDESMPDCTSQRVLILQAPSASLQYLSESQFTGIKHVCLEASRVLWVYSSDVPESAMSIGLARTLRAERMAKIQMLGVPSVNLVSDWPSETLTNSLSTLWFSADCKDIKDMELWSENGQLMVPRVVEDDQMNDFVANEMGTPTIQLQPYNQVGRRFKIQIGSYGALDSIHYMDDSVRALADKEVEIQVQATGVNFKDIVVCMGKVSQPYIGVECSGIVSAVGKGVTSLQVGQRVMAMTEGAYSTYAHCLETSACPIDDDTKFEEAATLPVVFCTAYYGLFDLGRLGEGERILIHAAAGGVGQAAIMLAKMVGAEVFATVGSEEKKHFLMNHYGIPEDHIFGSRDTSFGNGIRMATGNIGVDVVLNSLAGDILRETWDCIAPFGRFIEIGKSDITRNSRLDMLKFEYNCTFASVDLTKVASYKPQLMRRLLSDVKQLITNRSIAPIYPVKVYPISETEKAFRALQSGKTMGKLVVVPGLDEKVMALKARATTDIFRADATYVLVGGAGGLGRSVAKWMSCKGARHIVLTSRNPTITPKIQDLIDQLAGHGTKISVFTCDVSSKTSVQTLAQQCLKSFPPVRGILHGAMVLKDVLFEQMTLGDFQAVTACKVDGIQNLHTVFEEQPLDFFIAFSSVAGVVGNRGQGAYAAANVYLDAFMGWRRSLGLPGVSIDLAAVSNVGYLADGSDEYRTEVLKNIGGATVDESEVLALLAAAVTGEMNTSCAGQCITGLDGATPESFWLDDARFTSINEDLVRNGHHAADHGSAASLSVAICSASHRDDAIKLLSGGLVSKISAILDLPADAVEPTQTLKELGLDSLVAIELRNWIAREVEVSLQVLELLSSGSITSLADLILKKRGI